MKMLTGGILRSNTVACVLTHDCEINATQVHGFTLRTPHPQRARGQSRAKRTKTVLSGRQSDPDVCMMPNESPVNAAYTALLICPACSSKSTPQKPVAHETIEVDFGQNPTVKKSLLHVQQNTCTDCGSAQGHTQTVGLNCLRAAVGCRPRQVKGGRVQKHDTRSVLVAASLAA